MAALRLLFIVPIITVIFALILPLRDNDGALNSIDVQDHSTVNDENPARFPDGNHSENVNDAWVYDRDMTSDGEPVHGRYV